MTKIVLLSAMVSATLAAMLPGTPAQALNDRSWVASYGGGNLCIRSQPCADFQTAHDATNPGGEVNCVDAGNFSVTGLTIYKSITIDCGGTVGGVVGVIIIGGAGIIVRLRNLTIQGLGPGNGVGIDFLRGAALYVENCAVYGYQGGVGIQFLPENSDTSSLYVTDSIISNNGTAATGGGIGIIPFGSGSARVTIERSRVEGNTYGIFALGFNSTGSVIVQIKDSVVANNTVDGIGAYTSAGAATISITVDHSSSVLNGGSGIAASGPNAFTILAGSTVMSNVTGLHSASGGAILSYQNNQLAGNTTDGAPTGMLSVK